MVTLPHHLYIGGEGSGVEQILSYETTFLCVVIEKLDDTTGLALLLKYPIIFKPKYS